MLLELTAVEAREFKEVLDTSLRELLAEIDHADNRAFRDMLRERYERLEQLGRKLAASGEGEQVYA
jgi:hypothetical protein